MPGFGMLGAAVRAGGVVIPVPPIPTPEPPTQEELYGWWSPRSGHVVVNGAVTNWLDQVSDKSFAPSGSQPPFYRVSGSDVGFISHSFMNVSAGVTGSFPNDSYQGLVHTSSLLPSSTDGLIKDCPITIAFTFRNNSTTENWGWLSAARRYLSNDPDGQDTNTAYGWMLGNDATDGSPRFTAHYNIRSPLGYHGNGVVGIWILQLDAATNGNWYLYQNDWETEMMAALPASSSLESGVIAFPGRVQHFHAHIPSPSDISEILIYTSSLSESDRHDLYNYMTASISGTGGF